MITQHTVQSLLEARSFTDRNGATNIKWLMEPATLVERARNAAVRGMIRDNAQWLLFIDGDTVFSPDAALHALRTAYADYPHADVVGGYVPLRGDIALPTIDTGTGTWESWFPGSGVVEVMRTGCAFLLIKRHVLDALRDPWFRVRVPARPIDFMLEVDNFARIKFDGRNPLRDAPEDAWAKLEKCARDDPSAAPENFTPIEVGEDSGFCDRVRAAGFRIFVNTDISCGHVDTRILWGADHKKAVADRERMQRLLAGVTA
jgi:hypothetical protein